MAIIDVEYVAFNVEYSKDLKGKKNKIDQRVSTCSDCGLGIFQQQEREWTNRGLVHTECNSEVKVESA